MERYTYFDGGKFRLKIGDTEYSGDWVNRLAAYEETRLEPEEIMEAVKLFSGTNVDVPKEIIGWVKRATWHCKRLAELTRLVSFDRLRQLAEAEKDGRLRIVGVPKGACCGTCEHFEREAGTSHGACKPENHNWVAQSRTACKGHYTPISEAALEERECSK